jgi:diguanylate cyclase (GGDEF)-like protein
MVKVMADAALLEIFFRDAPELLVLLSPNRRVKTANPAFRATVRAGRDGTDFMDLVVGRDRDRVLNGLVRAAAGGEVVLEVPHPGPKGGERIVEYRFFPIEGGMVAGIGRARPVEEEEEQEQERTVDALDRAEAELKEKARILDEIQLELTQVPFIDPVTGVWNRLQVIERLTGEWSRSERYGSPIACLFVDVEGLDEVRRREGAALGDEALKSIARRIKALVRDHDVVGRYGGDRFVVLAVHADTDGARSLAARIEKAVQQEPVAVGGRTARVAVRIGGATNRSEGVEILEDLFAVAGSALEDARSRSVTVSVVEEA